MFSRWRGYLGRNAAIQDRYTPLRQTLAELFNCPHCTGVWFAGIVYLFRKQLRPLWAILAIAGAQSLMQSLDDRGNE